VHEYDEYSEEQDVAKPLHSPSVMHPSVPRHCVSVSNEHGVAVPLQYGTPDPGPVRWHHLLLLQIVLGPQSALVRQLITQTWAPMQKLTCPHLDVQSVSAEHEVTHCLWAM
jgi:hypothetical protein